MKSFLQTEDWAEYQRSLGRSVFKYDQDGIKSFVFKYDMPFRKWYFYIPHGPEIDFNSMKGGFHDPINKYLHWLRDLAKKEKAVFIKVEPLQDNIAQVFAERKFKKSKKELQPSKTVILDLTQSEEELLAKMHHKTRYNIRVAEKHGINIEDSSNDEIFWELLKKTVDRDKFFTHGKSYYQKLLSLNTDAIKTVLVLAYKDQKPVAGAIILVYGDTGYYLHGASDHDSRHMMAPFMLHWENIKYLKQKGIKNYDLYGIDSHRWPGVTRFKLGWGGNLIEYPGSFDLSVSKFWYMMYKIAKKFR